MMKFQWLMRVFVFVLVVFSVIWRLGYKEYNSAVEFNSQRITNYIETLINLRLANGKLIRELENLNQKIIIQQNVKELSDIEPIAPSQEYEVLRRRIYSNTKEFWYFVNSGLKSLKTSMIGVERIQKIKNMVDEHYRSLLNDVAGLAEVDNYSTWRQQESERLSILVQSRLEELQNPPNWFIARQLVCKFEKICGFGCQLHHIVYCFGVAYSTQRMLVLDYEYWGYGDVWPNVFLPLSDTSTLLKNITIVEWPGDHNSQIIHLPPIDSIYPRPYFLPPMIPDDLAPRLTILHGDPIVWWIGQIFKYLLRPQTSTSHTLEDYANKLKFKKPIVGVHIRRTDKIGSEASLHTLDEYMFHVEDYYKQKELSGEVNQKRIYLATDEPTLFDVAKHNYPEYEIIGSDDISKTASVINRKSKQALIGILVDIHFLSISDHIVCTFSSQLCRIAYEIMNSLHPDASTRFTSLDDIYYFGGQNNRINVAVLPHKAVGPDEIDLEVDDQIFVYGNHWDGYSKGKNSRTGLVGLFPTFKVIPKIQTANITDTETKISQDGKHENNEV